MSVAFLVTECSHVRTARTNGQTHCRDCGEAILSFCKEENRFFDDNAVASVMDRKVPKSIRKELDLLPLPDEIKDRADRIYAYKVGDNTYRANVRQEVKFCCIFEAYKEAGIARDPNEIAELLGIKRKGMSRGIMRCSSLFTGKANMTEQTSLTALDLVPEMMSRCGVQVEACHLEDMARIYHHAKDRSEMLNRAKTQSIAAALIFYYLSNMELDRKITKNEIAKSCRISVMTLTKLHQDIQAHCTE